MEVLNHPELSVRLCIRTFVSSASSINRTEMAALHINKIYVSHLTKKKKKGN